MRKALVVGVNYYEQVQPLSGCVNDAYAVKSVLERHSDGTPNFGVHLMTAVDASDPVTRRDLKDAVVELFADDVDIAMFYFSGHGYIENTGGFLVTSECADGDQGLSMDELMAIVNGSPAKNKVVILDSCYSGNAGNTVVAGGQSVLGEGVTILTASSKDQYSFEEDGGGVFTSLFVDALSGSAANLVGDITPGSVYAHIDQSLGPWEQRPIFKTNVRSFTSLRRAQPPIALADLQQLTQLFAAPDDEFPLDPSFEPESECPVEENTLRLATLQRLNRVNLVVPVGEDHMYFAAMNSKSCRLTVLGVHYWRLVAKDQI